MGNRRRAVVRTMRPAIAAVCLVFAGCAPARPERIEWTAMGTIAAFQYRPWREDIDTTPAVRAASVRHRFVEIERLLSAHEPDSELNRLAPLGEAEILARCDPSVSNCYAAAFRLMRESGGAFNPRWRGPKTLDLGAIAKGFAVDAATEVDPELPCLVDLGGNLRSSGGAWKVGVAGSDNVLTLKDGMACATSAEYFRGRHIRDGRTGNVVSNDVLSVTVVHPSSAMLADGLSTTLFVLGRTDGDRFLKKHHPEARVHWIMKE